MSNVAANGIGVFTSKNTVTTVFPQLLDELVAVVSDQEKLFILLDCSIKEICVVANPRAASQWYTHSTSNPILHFVTVTSQAEHPPCLKTFY